MDKQERTRTNEEPQNKNNSNNNNNNNSKHYHYIHASEQTYTHTYRHAFIYITIIHIIYICTNKRTNIHVTYTFIRRFTGKHKADVPMSEENTSHLKSLVACGRRHYV